MVSLSNIQRLLAAQEQNRRIIEAKIAAGKRLNPVTRANIGKLTGLVPKKVGTKIVGLTKQKSKTRLQTDKQLRAEIAFQAKKAATETDLERFLKNEQRLLSGRLSLSEIRRDIARRKAKGLSKTPAQKRALARAVSQKDISRLTQRAKRKRARGIRSALITAPQEILSIKRAEAARSKEFNLGSEIFGDPVFRFGGRTKQEVIGRGGTFGKRVAGQPISETLSFVSGARKSTSKARIGLAQSLLGDRFGGLSRTRLSKIVATRERKELAKLDRPTFQQTLRSDVGFFTTEAIPITRPTKKRRLAAAKVEQARRTAAGRREIGRQDDFERIFVLGTQVTERGLTPQQQRNAELREQGFTPSQIRQINQGVTPTGILDPEQRLLAAQATQRQTEALRAEPTRQAEFAGLTLPQESPTPFLFDVPLVPATGRPTKTETFFPRDDVETIFSLGTQISAPEPDPFSPDPSQGSPTDIFGVTTPSKKKKVKRPKRKQTGFGVFDFGQFEIGGGITLGEAFEASPLFEPFR